ncbi:nuclear transport factor 2 family protein [Amycolatopsis sp. H6(2020)]|nr:nuclear transport factor 2 family protein [Amycolatopsis sp. H6(2020)]
MTAFPRAELDEMVQRWLEANERCEKTGDWRPLAAMYTVDATYGWHHGPDEVFVAAGRDEIRDYALGTEMAGLDGWTYPYQKVLVDDRAGEVVGFWKQTAGTRRPDGSPYEVAGIGGSWFRYAGEWQWSWQRDFFDLGNAAALFLEMLKAGDLSEGMKQRMARTASPQPGHHPRGESPVEIW